MLLALVGGDISPKDIENLNSLEYYLNINDLVLSDQIIESLANLIVNKISIKETNDFLLFVFIEYLRNLVGY